MLMNVDIISPDGLLDEGVCAGVHIGRGLVQHQHPVLAQDGPGQAHQLPTNEGSVLDCVWTNESSVFTWRWPTEKLEPPSDISVSSPSLRSATASARCTSCSTRHTYTP